MFHLKSLETFNWGPHPQQIIPFEPGVNLFAGENGSGKTTLFDAIRVALGDEGPLSRKRTPRDYIRKGESLSFVKLVVDNGPRNGRRPFQDLGFVFPDVTLCVKYEREGGTWRPKAYLHDGADFEVGVHDRQVPSLGVREYRKRLEMAGLSRGLLKVLNLGQGATDRICEYDEIKLFSTILEIMGDREIMHRYDQARQDLHQARQHVNELQGQHEQETRELQMIARRLERYREYAVKKEEREARQQEHALARYRDAVHRQEGARAAIEENEARLANATLEAQAARHEGEERAAELRDLDGKRSELRQAYSEARRLHTEAFRDVSNLESEIDKLRSTVRYAESIIPADLPTLEAEASGLADQMDALRLALAEKRRRRGEIDNRLKRLERDQSDYPDEVDRFRAHLEQAGIGHVLFCDAIEITDPAWVDAIEALLGPERFDIVILDPGRVVEAKHLAEEMEYPYYISRPNPADVHPASRSGEHDAPTAWDKVRVHEPAIRGWLRKLAEVRLVDSVEQGDRLAQQGVRSITRRRYFQDNRGGKSLRLIGRYCGRLAREQEIKDLQEQIAGLDDTLRQEDTELRSLDERLTSARQAIEEQQLRLRLPELTAGLSALATRHEELVNQCDDLDQKEQALQQQLEDMAGRRASLENAVARALEKVKKEEEQAANATRQIGENRRALQDAEQTITALQQEHDETVLSNATGRDDLKSPDWYAALIHRLEGELAGFSEEERDPRIEQIHGARVEEMRRLEDALHNEHLRMKAEEEDLQAAREEFNQHVELVCNLFNRRVREAAALANADADVRLIKEGEEWTANWRLELRIGFDGKSLVPFHDPSLSGGQAVITSLIILIAAVSVESAFQLMMLDEPYAHLDDGRTDEVGRFLHSTQAQFILTAPANATLRSISAAADEVIMLSKAFGEEEAPVADIIILADPWDEEDVAGAR